MDLKWSAWHSPSPRDVCGTLCLLFRLWVKNLQKSEADLVISSSPHPLPHI